VRLNGALTERAGPLIEILLYAGALAINSGASEICPEYLVLAAVDKLPSPGSSSLSALKGSICGIYGITIPESDPAPERPAGQPYLPFPKTVLPMSPPAIRLIESAQALADRSRAVQLHPLHLIRAALSEPGTLSDAIRAAGLTE
jgi:hypothetical protein